MVLKLLVGECRAQSHIIQEVSILLWHQKRQRQISSFLPLLLWPRPRNDTENEEGGRGLLFPLERRKQKPSARKDEREGCVLQKKPPFPPKTGNKFFSSSLLPFRERACKQGHLFLFWLLPLSFPPSHIEGEGGEILEAKGETEEVMFCQEEL